MKEATPDIREFCFSPDAPMDPANMMAVWARTYLTTEQFNEFQRLIKATFADGVKSSSVEQMISIVEMSKFLTD